MVGAILTQNTAWRNVDRALAELRRAGLLDPQRMREIGPAKLAPLVRSAGFTTSKPARLLALARFLFEHYGGDPINLRRADPAHLRGELLALPGIGPETADVILLYVGHHPAFVVDNYTRRILYRLGYIEPDITYSELRAKFMALLPHDRALYAEFHALFDTHAKRLCTKRAPLCNLCPLKRICLKRGVTL